LSRNLSGLCFLLILNTAVSFLRSRAWYSAAPERSNLHLSPMPLSMSGDRFGWETRQPRDDRKAKSELHTTNSCHCERTWRVIPIRCLTGPMEKGAWDVLSLSEAIPT